MFSAYGSDVWRLTTRVSLNYGVRYDSVLRPNEVNGIDRIAWDSDSNNVAPRAGVAWLLPRRLGVLRAAAGVHFGDIFPVTYSQVRFSPPGSTKYAIPAPDLIDPLRSLKVEGQAADARGNLYLLDPELATPYSYQYNLSWEPDLATRWRVQIGYVGSRSHKLLVMWYLNRAHVVPGFPRPPRPSTSAESTTISPRSGGF